MTAMTSYLQKKLMDDFLNIAAFTPPAALYLSLHTASPTDTGSHANEVSTSGSGYARQSIAGLMTAADSISGVSVNTTPMYFPTHAGSPDFPLTATTNWGTISYVGIEDAVTGGNMCLWGAPTIAKVVNIGSSYTVVAGQLSMTFDN